MSGVHLIALNRHLERRESDGFMRFRVPKVRCRDGFEMSVQASTDHYCTPRSNSGPWEEVEVGFPNRIEPLLWPHAESPGDLSSDVYGWVPIELVAAIIEVHGGLDEDCQD